MKFDCMGDACGSLKLGATMLIVQKLLCNVLSHLFNQQAAEGRCSVEATESLYSCLVDLPCDDMHSNMDRFLSPKNFSIPSSARKLYKNYDGYNNF